MGHEETFICEIWTDQSTLRSYSYSKREVAEMAAARAMKRGLDCRIWHSVVAYPVCPPALYQFHLDMQFMLRPVGSRDAQWEHERRLRDAGLWHIEVPF